MARRNTRPAFTLVEMLVVIGIMAILASLLLLATDKAISAARRNRTLGDFQSIAAAISAYKGDFGQIPLIDSTQTYTDVGNVTLCRALLAPGPAVRTFWAVGMNFNVGDCIDDNGVGWDEYFYCIAPNVASGTNRPYNGSQRSTYWVGPMNYNPFDGHAGMGFARDPGGSAYGPYLRPDQFKLAAPGNYWHLLDRYGNGILYYVANGKRTAAQLTTPEVNAAQWSKAGTPGSYADDSFSASGPTTYKSNAWCPTPSMSNMWEYAQNEAWFGSNVPGLQKFRAMLGDYSNDGAIDIDTIATGSSTITIQEQAQYLGAYILWSAGPDNMYGPAGNPPANGYKPADVATCDDILFSGEW